MMALQPVAFVIHTVCDFTGIARADLVSRRRLPMLVEARAAVIWVARENTERSLQEIGLLLGNRDHSTILHGYQIAEQKRRDDALYCAMLDETALLLGHHQDEILSAVSSGSWLNHNHIERFAA